MITQIFTGIGGMGSSGLILGFSTIGKGGGGQIFVGVLMVMIGIGFGLVALADFYMLTKVSTKLFTRLLKL